MKVDWRISVDRYKEGQLDLGCSARETYLVASLDQILETAQYGKSGTDGALSVNETARLGVARRLDLLVQLEARGEALFVGSDEVDVHAQYGRVESGKRVGRGRVDEDRRTCMPAFRTRSVTAGSRGRDVLTRRLRVKLTVGQGRQLADQPRNVELDAALVELIQESITLDPSVLVEEVLFRVGNGDDLELLSQGWGGELGEDGGSYSAKTDEGDGYDTGGCSRHDIGLI